MLHINFSNLLCSNVPGVVPMTRCLLIILLVLMFGVVGSLTGCRTKPKPRSYDLDLRERRSKNYDWSAPKPPRKYENSR